MHSEYEGRVEPSSIQWAYLAGFVDGEGCIAGVGKGPTYRAKLSVAQKHPEVLYKFKEEFGCGVIYEHSKRTGGYTWNVLGLHLEWLLRGMYPYLIGKKKQCEIAIKLCNRETSPRMQRVYFNKLKELKHVSN